MRYLIYGLVDPITKHLRYIGKTKAGLKRIKQHFKNWSLADDGDTHKANWIRKILEMNLIPEFCIIQEFEDPEFLSEAEVFWIKYFKEMGCPLTNLTCGGDGNWGFVRSNKTKELDRKAGINRWLNPEYRQRVLAKRYSRWTEEMRYNASCRQKAKFSDIKNRLLYAKSIRAIKNNTTSTFPSIHEASRTLNIPAGNICKVLKQERKSAGGYYFEYSS